LGGGEGNRVGAPASERRGELGEGSVLMAGGDRAGGEGEGKDCDREQSMDGISCKEYSCMLGGSGRPCKADCPGSVVAHAVLTEAWNGGACPSKDVSVRPLWTGTYPAGTTRLPLLGRLEELLPWWMVMEEWEPAQCVRSKKVTIILIILHHVPVVKVVFYVGTGPPIG